MIHSAQYILVTPVKNEEDSLPRLEKSVLNQTVLPKLWVIVDDGSTDESSAILHQLASQFSWVKTVRMSEGPREIGFHYSEVVKEGFKYALQLTKSRSMDYQYVGVVDADISFASDYYETLIARFEEDPLLGIASGGTYVKRGKRLIWEKTSRQWPTGGAMLISKVCFDRIGWQLSRSPDGVAFIRAMHQGFRTRNFKELIALQSRPTSAGDGYWRGFVDFGRTRYYMGYTPFFAMLYSVRLLSTYPSYHGFAFLVGYFSDYLRRREKIGDPEVLEFCRRRMHDKVKSAFTASRGHA